MSICADIKKMPLGKLSKHQIAKGFEALEEIAEAIKKKSNESTLAELTSKFFTIIPHNFGRNRPPVIKDDVILQNKKEMLLVSCAMYIHSVPFSCTSIQLANCLEYFSLLCQQF